MESTTSSIESVTLEYNSAINNELFPIQGLPEEVLEQIFSFLPFLDRKSASLVCTTWERLAFSPGFLRKVALKIGPPGNFIHKSNRRYRNILLNRHVYSNFPFQYVLEILDRFATDVESFQCKGHLGSEQVCMVLSRLSNLQQLIVGLDFRDWHTIPPFLQVQTPGPLNNELQIESLNVPNVTHLSISFTNSKDAMDSMAVLQRLAPQLKNVDLYSTELFIPLEQLQFPKAEVLKIGENLSVTQNGRDLRTFFAGFKLLKEVRLDCVVEEIGIDLITKACPGIELFEFKVPRFNSIPFHLLECLKYLKTLGLGPVYEVPANSPICNPLVSVKNLSMELFECEESCIERLRHLLPNVIAMDVTLSIFPDDDWTFETGLKHICRNFRELQRLVIDDLTYRNGTLSSLLDLEQLDQLEDLTFKGIDTQIGNMPTNPLLKRFVIHHPDWLSDEDLLELARKYPNLRYLELGLGRRVSSEGIAAFKSQLVNCVVHCVPDPTGCWDRIYKNYIDELLLLNRNWFPRL
ncbi:uncharacterized protein LOC109417326 [Aedes albopictus]|uniref:F-box domain-containing protein n=1 Tax=Aedes albopictus TaxID=7160 RepID=A0ABM2A5E3_AEDAL